MSTWNDELNRLAIQEWMGHADISTTEIYAHYAPDPTGGVAFAQKAVGVAAGGGLPGEAAPLPGF